MAERFIENDGDRKMLIRFIEAQKLPMTVNIEIGRQRSKAQNRLQRKWMKEIADQLGDQTPEEVRGFCKLTIGVPILRMENEKFREAYDRRVRPMPYEQKMAFMMEPFDLAVTRIMTTKQKTAYLDGVHRYFSERGIVLTNPGDLVWSEPEPQERAA
jgi:hypothetical protein